MTATSTTPAALEELLRDAARGCEASRKSLLSLLWGELEALVRGDRGMRRLRRSHDHVADVVVNAAEKLSRGWTGYLDWSQRNPEKKIRDWVRIVTKNAIRDYLRQIIPRLTLTDCASSAGLEDCIAGQPFEIASETREVVDFAEARLPVPQLRSLTLWLQGCGFDEVGAALGCNVDRARLDISAAIAALRRHFRKD